MSGHPDVFVGEDGWLFLRRGSNHSFDQLSGVYPLPDDFSDKWARLFSGRADYCTERGIRHILAIAPAKEVVYRDFLSDALVLSDSRPVELVRRAAGECAQMVYPEDEFQKKSRAEQLYFRRDTHWTASGSILFYRTVMHALGIKPLHDEDIQRSVGPMNDLGSKIGLEPEILEVSLTVKTPTSVKTFDNRIKPQGNKIIYEGTDTDLPVAVMFRDSFCTHSIALFAQHFRRIVCLWQPNWDWEILDMEKPDYIISQQAERFLVEVPDDLNGLTNEQYVDRKRKKTTTS
jgi:alginate O-acetyltransferase complex protein AlgJ